jgi:hypothetical protein
MKKYFYIMVAIFLILIVVIITVLYINRKKSSETTPPQTPTQVPNLPSPEELKAQGKTTVPTIEQGAPAVIKDPYKDASKVVSGNAEMRNTEYYDIVYIGDQKSFVITIKNSNLNDSRNKAEQAFLDSLGVSKNEACKLTVVLAVSPGANRDVAGRNYGLSFCPNGKPFPAN